jgi:hypothetical protein
MRVGPTSKRSLRIAILYTVFSAAWILFSDRAAAALAPDPATLVLVSTLKGWFFVVVTAALLFLLVRRQFADVAAAAEARARAETARTLAENRLNLASEAAPPPPTASPSPPRPHTSVLGSGI